MLCIGKCVGGVGEEVAVNVIGAPSLAFFNTFNLRHIKIVSSHVNSFISVSVASCTHKTQRANSVSLLETGGQFGQCGFERWYPVLVTALLVRGFRIFYYIVQWAKSAWNSHCSVLESQHGKWVTWLLKLQGVCSKMGNTLWRNEQWAVEDTQGPRRHVPGVCPSE